MKAPLQRGGSSHAEIDDWVDEFDQDIEPFLVAQIRQYPFPSTQPLVVESELIDEVGYVPQMLLGVDCEVIDRQLGNCFVEKLRVLGDHGLRFEIILQATTLKVQINRPSSVQ